MNDDSGESTEEGDVTSAQTGESEKKTLRRPPSTLYKKLSYHRRTARRDISLEILSTAAQLYEKSHWKRLAIGE